MWAQHKTPDRYQVDPSDSITETCVVVRPKENNSMAAEGQTRRKGCAGFIVLAKDHHYDHGLDPIPAFAQSLSLVAAEIRSSLNIEQCFYLH